MTVTPIVQVAPLATLPPLRLTVVPPAVAPTVPAPHVVVAFGVAAIVTPVGSASESARPVNATLLAAVFATVSVNVDVPPGAIDAATNALVSVTFGAVTVSVAVATAVFDAPCVLVTPPTGIVLT